MPSALDIINGLDAQFLNDPEVAALRANHQGGTVKRGEWTIEVGTDGKVHYKRGSVAKGAALALGTAAGGIGLGALLGGGAAAAGGAGAAGAAGAADVTGLGPVAAAGGTTAATVPASLAATAGGGLTGATSAATIGATLKKLAAAGIPVAALVQHLAGGGSPDGSGGTSGVPPELQQMLGLAMKRMSAQEPLFNAVNQQALAGLPNYAKGGQ